MLDMGERRKWGDDFPLKIKTNFFLKLRTFPGPSFRVEMSEM